uniref:Uncharacterized protein n=1 Tax=Meloidogyne hapla TaxID=6305 RepID=A0A1I8BE50_MELHA
MSIPIYIQLQPYLISISFILVIMVESTFNGIIEYIIISQHPSLKKSFNSLTELMKFLKSNRVANVNNNENVIPKTINGSPLMISNEMDKHFSMLKDAWN